MVGHSDAVSELLEQRARRQTPAPQRLVLPAPVVKALAGKPGVEQNLRVPQVGTTRRGSRRARLSCSLVPGSGAASSCSAGRRRLPARCRSPRRVNCSPSPGNGIRRCGVAGCAGGQAPLRGGAAGLGRCCRRCRKHGELDSVRHGRTRGQHNAMPRRPQVPRRALCSPASRAGVAGADCAARAERLSQVQRCVRSIALLAKHT